MATTKRTTTLPPEGSGEEPQTEADVMMLARSRIQAALPSGWTLRTDRRVGRRSAASDRQPDAMLSLVLSDAAVATYRVKVKRVLTRSGALTVADQIAALGPGRNALSAEDRWSWMVISRYISPQLQDLLRERGIAYADATGNLLLASDDPLILVSDRGATADPWRGPGRPTTSLKGLPAALLVRALADYAPPFTVPQLAEMAGTSLGATYRLVDFLSGEGLLTRTERGPITTVDWPELLRRWSQEARYLDISTTRGYLEPRGVDSLMVKLRELEPVSRYAVSGSLAAVPYLSYAEPRLAVVYAEDPDEVASDLGLRPVDTGANVILAAPRSPVVFERTTMWQGATIVAPSQTAADLLSGPGRNPAEGEHLLAWMKENEDAWRRQRDH